MASPPTPTQRPPRLASTAIAVLALLVAVAALVVALTRKQSSHRAVAPTAHLSIAPDSITGKQVDEATLGPVPRSRSADRAAEAARLGGRRAGDFLPAARVRATRGLVTLSRGQTKTVLSKSPFQFVGRCSAARGGARLVLTARSTETGSLITVAGRPLPKFGPGSSRDFLTLTGGKELWLSGQPLVVASARGSDLAGIVSLGVNAFGADCAASMFAIG